MDPREALRKAGEVTVGTDWHNTPSNVLGSYRDDVGTPSDAATLSQQQVKFLVDQMVEESVLLKEVRRVVMSRPRMEMPRIFIDDADNGLQATAAGGTPELAAGNNVPVTHNTVVLTTTKLVLPWVVSEEYLEDNPEGGGAEETIARIMAIRAANDMERLAINGDEAGAGPLIHANDGYIRLILDQTPAAQILDENSAPFTSDLFNRMMRAMPTKFRTNPRSLRFLVPPNVWHDYTDVLATRMGDMADRYLTDWNDSLVYKGIPVRMIPFMPQEDGVGTDESTIILTNPKNFIWGVQRDMKLRKTNEGKEAVTRDQRFYALFIRCDFQIENPNAVVLAHSVTPRIP